MGAEEATTATAVVESSELRPTPEIGVSRSYVWHVLGLLVVLIALIPIVDNGSFAIPDEGVYSAQADNLSNGSWAAERPASDIDSEGRWAVLSDSSFRGTDGIPYARRPLYPLMLTPFWKVGGLVGGIVLSIIGSWAAATVSGLIASRFDRRAAIPTLWLVGIGSPLLFDAYLLVGHSPAAAFAAVLCLAVVRSLESRSQCETRVSIAPAWAAVALAAAVALTLIRTEGVLLVAGLAVGVGGLSLDLRRRRVDPAPALFAFLLVVAGAATYALNILWAKTLTTGAGGDVSVVDRKTDATASFWYSVLRPWYPDNTAASVTMTLVVFASISAPLLLHFLPRLRAVAVGLLTMAAVASVLRLFENSDLISGLAATVPWLVVGLVLLSRDQLRRPRTGVLLCGVLVAFVGITLTAYGAGGASEWGGRFYHLLLPALAALGALGLLRLRIMLPSLEFRVAAVALLVIVLSLAVACVRASVEIRGVSKQLESFIIEESATDATGPLVFSPLQRTGIARVLWRTSSVERPLLTTPALGFLPHLLDDIPTGTDHVTVLTDISNRDIIESLVRHSEASRWSVDAAAPERGPLAIYRLVRIDAQPARG